MKIRLLILCSICLVLASGCASLQKAPVAFADEVKLVVDAFNGLLPDDFSGPLDFSRDDDYFNISLKAGNVHKNATTGKWSWDWVEYHRKTHIPWFSGAQWSSDVHFKIGASKGA